MLLDGPTLPRDEVLDADVCIVGAGPAGLTLARELVAAQMSVLVLEAGGRPDEAPDPDAARARSVGHSYFPVHTTRVRGLAGTSNHWYHDVGFRARPLDDVDFETRPEVPFSGWPLTRGDLDPFYERAHAVLGLGAFDYSPECCGPDRLLPLGPEVVTSVFRLVSTDAFQHLGEQLVQDDRLRLVLHSTVTSVEAEQAEDEVSHLQVRTTAGGFRVRARAHVLAAGGIDNARLLLASRSRQSAGLGNSNDLVGRFFMEHLSVRSGDWRPTEPRFVTDPAPYCAHTAAEEGVQLHAKLSPAPDVVRQRGLLNSTFFVDAMDEGRASPGTLSAVTLKHALVDRPRPPHLLAEVNTLLHHLPAVARVARRQLAQRRGRGHAFPDTLLQLRAMTEQAPNPSSRVRLDERERDRFGVPRAVLDWQLTDLDRRSVRAAQDVIDSALQRTGLGRLERKLGEERPVAHQRGQWHHMGTTRMAPDPRRGVVDADSRVHGFRNLFVAGSSVFPTGGYANPTLTLVALALRLSDHLRKKPWA